MQCYFRVMDFEKDRSAGYLVNQLARLFARALDLGIRPYGLSTGVFPALLQLWDQDGLTQKELVERLDIEQPTLANTLVRMERDGLILRRKDAQDGRAQRIWLTDHARALRSAAVAAASDVNARAMADFTAAERTQFEDLLHRATAALQKV